MAPLTVTISGDKFAGKSTIAYIIAAALAEQGINVVALNDDVGEIPQDHWSTTGGHFDDRPVVIQTHQFDDLIQFRDLPNVEVVDPKESDQ